jgi:hypothetical protein
MIQITINAHDAADARRQMLDLLTSFVLAPPGIQFPIEPTGTAGTAGTAQATSDTPVKPASRGRKKAAEAEAARSISTGEERADPAVEAQDKADEKAETDAQKAEVKKLTHDDVRTELGAYVKKFGMPAAQEDGPKVLALCFGEGKSKVSDIPDTQEALQKAVDGIKEMLEKNPFKREPAKAA